MDQDSRAPNDAQRRKLCEMLQLALMDIRIFSATGQGEQASDLADAFHNLPLDMWRDDFSLSFFRLGFVLPYTRKWGQTPDYLAMLEEVERLGG